MGQLQSSPFHFISLHELLSFVLRGNLPFWPFIIQHTIISVRIIWANDSHRVPKLKSSTFINFISIKQYIKHNHLRLHRNIYSSCLQFPHSCKLHSPIFDVCIYVRMKNANTEAECKKKKWRKKWRKKMKRKEIASFFFSGWKAFSVDRTHRFELRSHILSSFKSIKLYPSVFLSVAHILWQQRLYHLHDVDKLFI